MCAVLWKCLDGTNIPSQELLRLSLNLGRGANLGSTVDTQFTLLWKHTHRETEDKPHSLPKHFTLKVNWTQFCTRSQTLVWSPSYIPTCTSEALTGGLSTMETPLDMPTSPYHSPCLGLCFSPCLSGPTKYRPKAHVHKLHRLPQGDPEYWWLYTLLWQNSWLKAT